MTRDQLKKLMEWIDARIDYKIEQASGRDPSLEYIRETAIRDELSWMFKEDE